MQHVIEIYLQSNLIATANFMAVFYRWFLRTNSSTCIIKIDEIIILHDLKILKIQQLISFNDYK